MLWLKKKKKAFCPTLKWRCGYDACAPCPQLSSPVHQRRHQQGSGLLMRVDFHNSHIVTTRYKDYYFNQLHATCNKVNNAAAFYMFYRIFGALGGFKVLAGLFKCVIQNKLELSRNNCCFGACYKTYLSVNLMCGSPHSQFKWPGKVEGRRNKRK